MMKVLLALCCIFIIGISIGCTQEDAEDVWTQNIYPSVNNTYDVGSPTLQYQDGYFTNIWVSNNGSFGNITSGYYYGNGSKLSGVLATLPATGNFTNINVTNNGSFGNITLSGNITAYGIILTAPLLVIAPVWEDMRIVPGSFDRPGTSDPAYVAYAPNGGATSIYLTEWKKNDIASATIQLPHAYKEGTNISCHIHWTAGADGVTENGQAVGWKVSYTWADMDSTFGNMSTLNLSDACDGVNHKHQMTPDISINGSGKTISSMLLLNIERTDTGADDTWTGSTSGHLPMMLEMDLHYQIDTLGSSSTLVK